MGNRAVIKFKGEDCGIYLHWNGGRDSVEAFLDYCRMRGFRSDDYGVARMAQVIGNWFGGELSLGVISTSHSLKDLDPGDNGVYIVDNWKIVGRYPRDVREQNEYDRKEMLESIDSMQPKRDQLGKKFLNGEDVPVADIKKGDRIFISEYSGGYKVVRVVGFGKAYNNKVVPIVNRYGKKMSEIRDNGNNYLTGDVYRKVVV